MREEMKLNRFAAVEKLCRLRISEQLDLVIDNTSDTLAIYIETIDHRKISINALVKDITFQLGDVLRADVPSRIITIDPKDLIDPRMFVGVLHELGHIKAVDEHYEDNNEYYLKSLRALNSPQDQVGGMQTLLEIERDAWASGMNFFATDSEGKQC